MIAGNWIRSRDEAPLFLDGQLEVYRGCYGTASRRGEYSSARTEADFAHGLCPDCLDHHYDEMDIHDDERIKEYS
jgi:hypothetical protein